MVLGIALGVVALVSFFVWTVKRDTESYEVTKEANSKWLKEQPRCQVGILLDSTLIRSPNFSATLQYVGRGYSSKVTAEEVANDWITNAFERGYMEVNGILYPTTQITKMYMHEVK